jgi:anti-sigma regulatory factor (Ser/Thr protein kinase)
MQIRDVYSVQEKLKIVFIVIAVAIVFFSMYTSNRLVKKLSLEEHHRMELLAEATRHFVEANDGEDLTFVLKVIEMNSTIPVIIIDEKDNLINYRNIQVKGDEKAFFKKEIQTLKAKNPPIEIVFSNGTKQYFYYDDSLLLTQLSYFPYVQLSIIIVFLSIVAYAFSTTKKAEQNQVWVGLSRETAHQLGTPISSLLAWVEILRDKNLEPKLIQEMSKDVNRLRTIAERFSKIGSKPALDYENLETVLKNAINYMRNRISQKVKIEYKIASQNEILLPLNISLFEWVVENLCKNSIDAMDGSGEIKIQITEQLNNVIIEFADNGKGIPKSKFKTIFNPGYTTKKRGWGLGLSLVKRIVEEYHEGKIFVKSSEINKGTTFRIVLPLKKRLL